MVHWNYIIGQNNTASVTRLPWFRVHIVILNDPGRLIGSHLMHTAQISGWIGSMLLYEVLVVDRTDTVFNPVWRQGCYAMPIAVRLGAVSSVYGWNLGISQVGSVWSYESIVVSHIVFRRFNHSKDMVTIRIKQSYGNS